MKTAALAVAITMTLCIAASFVGGVALAWIASAPGHGTESNRAFLLFSVGLGLLMPTIAAWGLWDFWREEDR